MEACLPDRRVGLTFHSDARGKHVQSFTLQLIKTIKKIQMSSRKKEASPILIRRRRVRGRLISNILSAAGGAWGMPPAGRVACMAATPTEDHRVLTDPCAASTSVTLRLPEAFTYASDF